MTKAKSSVNISLSNQERIKLEEIALNLGCLWGSGGSITRLLAKIASDELSLSPKDITDGMRIVSSLEEISSKAAPIKHLESMGGFKNDFSRAESLQSLQQKVLIFSDEVDKLLQDSQSLDVKSFGDLSDKAKALLDISNLLKVLAEINSKINLFYS